MLCIALNRLTFGVDGRVTERTLIAYPLTDAQLTGSHN